MCCQSWFVVLLKLHSVIKSTAQSSNTLHVGDGEQLPAAMSTLEMKVKELSKRYVLPFSMLGLLFPSSVRGETRAQSAPSHGSHKITAAPGFRCFSPRTEATVVNLLWSSPQLTGKFFLLFPRSLEIQQEEKKDLKAALEKAARKREEDFLMYQIVMGQVRDKFPEALQQHTQGKS